MTGVIAGSGGTGLNPGTPFATGSEGGGGGGGGGIPVAQGNETALVEVNDVAVATASHDFVVSQARIFDGLSTSVREIIKLSTAEAVGPGPVATVTDAAATVETVVDDIAASESIDGSTLAVTFTDVLVSAIPLPTRVTPPTFSVAGRDPNVNGTTGWSWDNVAVNDVGVFMTSVVAIGATLTSIDDYTNPGQTWLADTEVGSGLGTIFSLVYMRREGVKIGPVPNPTDTANMTYAGGSNYTGIVLRAFFEAASVDGTPILASSITADAVDLAANPEGYGLSGDDFTFPAVDIPAGYTAVYLFTRHNDGLTTSSWGVATFQYTANSFTGLGTLDAVATLDGPSDGAGVYFREASNATNIASYGVSAAIILVPGTP